MIIKKTSDLYDTNRVRSLQCFQEDLAPSGALAGTLFSCKSLAVFLHFPLEEKGSWAPFISSGSASKKETPSTSNLTESTA